MSRVSQYLHAKIKFEKSWITQTYPACEKEQAFLSLLLDELDEIWYSANEIEQAEIIELTRQVCISLPSVELSSDPIVQLPLDDGA